ncbi:hypothetical protein CTheo_6315 [Ceratobasidium theobromae]|uniref:Potassium channel domain-containing protein n=1 Tax=Ceratobasidium theobromae TaxID=1582974 RepID=A0A5N5QG12_9AGAM|nr:hypothetical protein CTheo_6315 [Ceratobasidium theobromae]
MIPIFQALFRKRRPNLDANVASFESNGRAERGTTGPPALSIWDRLKDRFWVQEDDESRREYIPNFRWTPILSGVIIPFAILLEIPGLTEHWYIRTVDNKTVETQENPRILDIGLAFSMTSALFANVALIFRFLERRVQLATFVAIGGLIIHDIINIIIVAIFGVIHGVDDGFTYGQAFWMIICSTLASIITTVSLIWDWARTPEFARSGSGLTRKQRSLVIIVMVLLCYIALGAMCYSFIIGISFQDGLYFTVVSIETVGFGDIILTTTLGRIFSMFYNTFGIINLGLAVSTTRETIIESFENSYRKRRAQRERLKHTRAQIRAAEQMLHRMGAPVYVPLPLSLDREQKAHLIHAQPKVAERKLAFPSMPGSASRVHSGSMRSHGHSNAETMVLNVWALSGDQRIALFGDQRAVRRAGLGMKTVVGVGLVTNLATTVGTDAGQFSEKQPGSPTSIEPDGRVGSDSGTLDPAIGTSRLVHDSPASMAPDPMTLIERFHAELGGSGHDDDSGDYTELKTKLEKEEKKEFFVKLSVAWSLFVAFWLIGSGVFVVTEGWPFFSSMFFCFCTFSTVGYGDFAPKTPAGRAFFVGWALFGIAAMTILISGTFTCVIHSSVLERAVKSTRAQHQSSLARQRTSTAAVHQPRPDHNALAVDIVTNARAIKEHMSWFVNSSGMKGAPDGVLRVLDDIAQGGNMDGRLKKDLMSDDEARKAVFVMSFERMLHNLACVAEEAARMSRQAKEEESCPSDVR